MISPQSRACGPAISFIFLLKFSLRDLRVAQMDDLANGLISFCILLPWLPLLKNDVVMYTWPAQTARTRNILSTFIQVWELAVSSVTNWTNKQKSAIVSNLCVDG